MIYDGLILRMFDAEGNYIGHPSRKLLVNAEVIDIDEYAANSNGRLVLPDAEQLWSLMSS